MMKCKVVNLEAYKKFRPIKRKIKLVKKYYYVIINKLRKIFIEG